MEERNYNGYGRWTMDDGRWTVEAVKQRYREYVGRYGVETPIVLEPKIHESGDVRWIYPIMDQVIVGIESGDAACDVLGIEFIEEDRKFPFEAVLKSNVARALRRTELSKTQASRIRRRIVNMLKIGNTPREFKKYAKLLRKLGVKEVWKQIEGNVPTENKYAMRYYRYFQAVFEESASLIRKSKLTRHDSGQ